MSTSAVEIVYRGVSQNSLARKICHGIVLAARRENRLGFIFGRYGDSPERIGIPAKQFVVVGDSERELQSLMTSYELDNNDVTVVLEDTLCRGIESWAWHGLQPINKLTKPGGTLLVVSRMSPDDLIRFIPMKGAEYNLAVVRGSATRSTLWKYNDDHSDARVLGVLSKIAPHIISFNSLEYVIIHEWKQEYKVDSAHRSLPEVQIRRVLADEGLRPVSYQTELSTWQQMREALVIPAVPSRERVRGEPYRLVRNPDYKNLTARTNRPLVDFTRCSRCSLCWLHCPDSCFDVMPEGFYDTNLEYCSGCGICAAICPVKGCITMVPERCFIDNASQWEKWQQDKGAYARWVEEITGKSLTC